MLLRMGLGLSFPGNSHRHDIKWGFAPIVNATWLLTPNRLAGHGFNKPTSRIDLFRLVY